LAICILVLSLASSAFHQTSGPEFRSPNIDNARNQILTPSFDEEDNLLPLPEEGEEGSPLETPIEEE
jgi:preprotein translocase subunit SecG